MPKKCAEPGFLKYIDKTACTKRLRLPPTHLWNKEREFPDRVTLQDVKGNTWSVKLQIIKDEVCFVDGWLEFVKDNHVAAGSSIVFQKAGPNVLSFQLFDSNECQIEGFSGLKSVIILGYKAADEEGYDDSDSGEESVNCRRNTSLGKEFEEDAVEDGYDDYVPGEKESVNCRIGPDDMPQKKTRTKLPKAYDEGTSKGSNDHRYDIYRNKIFESGVISRPKNPYFVTRKRKRSQLYVPIGAVQKYNIHLPNKTIMEDTLGNQWVTKLNERDGKFWYKGGWTKFCKLHDVGDDEDIVCEFVEDDELTSLLVYKLCEKG